MTDEQPTREDEVSPEMNRHETDEPGEFSGWANAPENARTEPERGGDYHPGAASVPKEPAEEDSGGMR